MSWKIVLSAGLLCVLAAPVFADPVVTITNGGLNPQGNWIWNVQVSNTDADGAGPGTTPPSGLSALATELGFKLTVAELQNAARVNQANNFDLLNPGNAIFAWQTGANNMLDTTSSNKPTGIQTNCPSGNCSNESRFMTGAMAGAANEVFAALGSVNYNTIGPHDFIQIITKGPIASQADSVATITTRKTVIEMMGVMGVGNVNGRVAELTSATASTNYDTYAQTWNAFATAGDADLINGVDLTDFNTVLGNLGSGVVWQQGNFDGNGTGVTDLTDFNTVLGSLGAISGGQTAGVGPLVPPGAGTGFGGGSTIPEPTSAVLFCLGIISFLTARRRK